MGLSLDPEAGTVLLSRNLRWDSRGHVSDKRETLTRNCASWFWLPRAEKWKGSPTAWEGPRYRPGECGLCWGTFLVWVKKKILTEVITGQSSMNIIWPNKRQGRTIRTQTPGGLGSLRPPGLDTLSPRVDWQPRALDTTLTVLSPIATSGAQRLPRGQAVAGVSSVYFPQPASPFLTGSSEGQY